MMMAGDWNMPNIRRLWQKLIYFLASKIFSRRMKKESFQLLLAELGRFEFTNFFRLLRKFLLFKSDLLKQNLSLAAKFALVITKSKLRFKQSVSKSANVSIGLVVVSHGRNQFLIQTLNSIAWQTKMPDEIIIVISGNDDDVISTVDSLEHSDLKNYRFVTTGSHAAGYNRNLGASFLTSSHLVFLDGDDVLKQKAIEVFYNHAIFFEHTPIAASCSTFPNLSFYHLAPRISNRSLELFNQLNVTTLISKEIFDRTGGFRDSAIPFEHQPEDWDFWYRLTKNGSVILSIRDILYGYRIHLDSTSKLHNQFANEKNEYWRFAIKTSETAYWSSYTSPQNIKVFHNAREAPEFVEDGWFLILADNLQSGFTMAGEKDLLLDKIILVVLKAEVMEIHNLEETYKNIVVFALDCTFVNINVAFNFLLRTRQRNLETFGLKNSKILKLYKFL